MFRVLNLQKAREPYHIVVRGGHLNWNKDDGAFFINVQWIGKVIYNKKSEE
jgi:hypothetical protein